MMQAFTYAALWRGRDALPGLLQLLPEPARSEVARIAGEAAALTPAELSARISDLRNRDLAAAESAVGSVQSCPASVLEWKYRRHMGEKA
jgi:hypothetical protein